MTIERRRFIRNAALGISSALLARQFSLAATADARIEILLDEPLGTISPNIYGHFAENLGGVVYDGIWIGKIRRSRMSRAFGRAWWTRCAKSKRR